MNEQVTFWTPQAMARKLDISTATLRRWSDEFSEHLSQQADSAEGRSHRRYTDEDLDTLLVVKNLMNSGLTYEQARQQLAGHEGDDSAANDDEAELNLRDEVGLEPEEDRALVAANGNESPAIAFLTNTLATLSDTQKSILNSQSANRELLGVLIQDNFNLKEENNRLRERILDIERSLAQSRQDEEWRREALRQELEAKVASAQQLAQQALMAARSVEAPEIKAVKSKPGCLGALLGASDTEIVTVPRRRSREGRGIPTAGPASGGVSWQQSSPPAQQRPIHPKPTAPPE